MENPGILARLGNAVKHVITSRGKQGEVRRNYPQSGTGKRQGERMQRNRRLYDFSASERCITRIQERATRVR